MEEQETLIHTPVPELARPLSSWLQQREGQGIGKPAYFEHYYLTKFVFLNKSSKQGKADLCTDVLAFVHTKGTIIVSYILAHSSEK